VVVLMFWLVGFNGSLVVPVTVGGNSPLAEGKNRQITT
jgi:hypothetical protein